MAVSVRERRVLIAPVSAVGISEPGRPKESRRLQRESRWCCVAITYLGQCAAEDFCGPQIHQGSEPSVRRSMQVNRHINKGGAEAPF